MHLATQLSVFLENRPGTLAEICRVLSAAKINIIAITTTESIDHAVLRMVVDEPRKALRLLEERGVLVIESDVLQIEGSNHPGSLSTLAEKLGDHHINIDYIYFATPPRSRSGIVILRTANVKKAMKILNKHTARRSAKRR